MGIKSTTETSKWIKTKWLLKDKKLKRYVPKTKLFNHYTLASMVSSYPTVYFKPTKGTGGKRIVRIKRLRSGSFSTKHHVAIKKFSFIDELYDGLNQFAQGKSYLLQKGIRLAKYKGKPFDLRVMVQKTKKKGWVPSAILAKVGKPGKVVTNYHQGGKLVTLRKTLRGAGYNSRRIRKTRTKLKRMGRRIGTCFDRHRKGFRELGIDVAIDRKGKVWILEVNTNPCFYPLKHLSKTMYQRVLTYAREYGRTKG